MSKELSAPCGARGSAADGGSAGVAWGRMGSSLLPCDCRLLNGGFSVPHPQNNDAAVQGNSLSSRTTNGQHQQATTQMCMRAFRALSFRYADRLSSQSLFQRKQRLDMRSYEQCRASLSPAVLVPDRHTFAVGSVWGILAHFMRPLGVASNPSSPLIVHGLRTCAAARFAPQHHPRSSRVATRDHRVDAHAAVHVVQRRAAPRSP